MINFIVRVGREVFQKPLVLHPFLIVILYLINTFTLIPVENLSLTNFCISFLIIYGFTFFFLIISKLTLKEKIKAGIFSTIIVSTFLYYKDIHFLLFKLKFIVYIRSIIPIPTILLYFVPIYLIVFFILLRTTNKLARLNSYLNYLFTILIVFNVGLFLSNKNHSQTTLKNGVNLKENNKLKIAPNIYYIILDSYTSAESLEKYWGFDNSEFQNHLIQQGFFIACKSKSKYTLTPFSIAASLNMSYLNCDSTLSDDTEVNNSFLFKLIRSNRLVNYLSKNNYEIRNLSFFEIGKEKKHYITSGFFNENSFLARTLFDIVLSNTNGYTNKTNLQIFSALQNQATLKCKNSFFVYAHIMMPHYPYFFDENGKIMPDSYSGGQLTTITQILHDRKKYLSQLIYTNKLTIETINAILKNSKIKPIIIIQGDHGFRHLPERNKDIESHTIFNSYYFPDNDYKYLNDSINPVNSFRVILNKYFDENLEIIY